MGNVYPTVPVELARRLIAAAEIDGAIETGTFYAQGALALRDLVSRVWTIELSDAFHAGALQRYGHVEGVTFLQGEASLVLRELSGKVPPQPLLFWLDAHGGTDLFDIPDAEPQCPLLGEIEAIRRFPRADGSCILVDDARFFLGPVAGPSICRRPADWPTLVEVIDSLRFDADRYITILDDVIVSVPSALRPIVDEWWLALSRDRQGNEAFEYLFHRAINPTPAMATKRLVKSLVPTRIKAHWYHLVSRMPSLKTLGNSSEFESVTHKARRSADNIVQR